MGGQSSSLRRCLEEEFSRLATQGRKYLVLDQLLQLRLPPSAWVLDSSHLGVLFVLDRSRSGKITLDDLMALAELVRARMRCYQLHEFQTQMQGFCTLQLWRAVATDGEAAVCNWLLQMIGAAAKTCRFNATSKEIFLHEEGLRLLYGIFRVEETQGVQFAECLNFLQRAGEDTGLMDIEDSRQDQWVPVTVVRQLLAALVGGMSKVMEDVFPHEELSQLGC